MLEYWINGKDLEKDQRRRVGIAHKKGILQNEIEI